MLAITLADLFFLFVLGFFNLPPSSFAQEHPFRLCGHDPISVLAKERSWKLMTQHVGPLQSEL